MTTDTTLRLPAPGDSLPELVVEPSPVTLFRFSSVTWNPHRIHYDVPYAATEGYPGVLVHSHLHGSFIAECVLRWGGPGWKLGAFSWRNRGAAFAGQTLTVRGRVEAVDADRIECVLDETNQDGELCATGRAVLIRKPESE